MISLERRRLDSSTIPSIPRTGPQEGGRKGEDDEKMNKTTFRDLVGSILLIATILLWLFVLEMR